MNCNIESKMVFSMYIWEVFEGDNCFPGTGKTLFRSRNLKEAGEFLIKHLTKMYPNTEWDPPCYQECQEIIKNILDLIERNDRADGEVIHHWDLSTERHCLRYVGVV